MSSRQRAGGRRQQAEDRGEVRDQTTGGSRQEAADAGIRRHGETEKRGDGETEKRQSVIGYMVMALCAMLSND